MLSFRFFPVVHHLKTAHQNVRNKLSNGNKICPRQKFCSGVVYLEIDDSDPPKKKQHTSTSWRKRTPRREVSAHGHILLPLG